MPIFTNQTIDQIANKLYELYNNKTIKITKNFILAFFCTMFRADIFKRYILSDIFENGYGEDVDFCLRVLNDNFNIVYIPSAYVAHNHRTTFKSVYNEQQIKDIIKNHLQQAYIVNSLNINHKKKGVIYTCITREL